MLNSNNCNIMSRRRRLLKYLVGGFCVMSLLYWTRVQNSTPKGHNLTINGAETEKIKRVSPGKFAYQKADFSDLKEQQGLNYLVTDSISELHKAALIENTDEFLEPVLKDVSYHEVDLTKAKVPRFDDYDNEIEEDEKKVKPGLGDGGEKAKVPQYQSDVAQEIMKKEAFNRLLSEMISPNRTTPDTRDPACRSEVYDENLPDMSVIIIFTNEAFTSLVRTLHSVVNRTPAKLLREIILVDDYSDRRDLKGKLERYIATRLPVSKIRFVRLHKRSGLIRARMIGAHLAIGDVLLFLDAHCECTEDWAQPLLARIKEERTAVVCPIIDVIDDKTMEYYHGNGNFFQIGGFTWSGHFTWVNIPKYEALRKKHHHSPTRSPTMAGGLFAIDRRYFWEIGSYDSDMQLWGGENLEMSFRIWQCGGSVEIIPCSRVGHIFRNFHPYTFPNNVDSHGLNTARLAEVWMDDYKQLFYAHRKELKSANIGDVSKRLAFRKRLNCKSFKWYLDNIYKEKFQMIFDAKYYGQVKNRKTNHCLDNMQHGDSEEYSLAVYPCHIKLYPSQTFMLSRKGELRRENECATEGSNNRINMVQCEIMRSDEAWNYNPDTQELISLKYNECLTINRVGTAFVPIRAACVGSELQKWEFDPHQATRATGGVDADVTDYR